MPIETHAIRNRVPTLFFVVVGGEEHVVTVMPFRVSCDPLHFSAHRGLKIRKFKMLRESARVTE